MPTAPVPTRRDTFQKFFEPAEIQALLEDTLHTEGVPVGLGIYLVFRDTAELHDFLASRSRRLIDWESLSRRLGLLKALKAKRDPYDTHRELLDAYWEAVLELGRMPRDEEFDRLTEVRHACDSLPRALQLFIDRFGEPTFAAARQRRKEDLLVFIAAAQLRHKIPFSHLSLRLQRDLRSFFGSYANAEEMARELMFAAGDADELEIAASQLDFGHLDPKEGHFSIHRSLIDELPVILRVYVECAARLYGNPREADPLHFRSLFLFLAHGQTGVSSVRDPDSPGRTRTGLFQRVRAEARTCGGIVFKRKGLQVGCCGHRRTRSFCVRRRIVPAPDSLFHP